ncbi:MAG TPA: type IV pilus modification protein PilV [Burkholderiales bacterium]|nr:type IV pilus modification protein PilV [Burkholderiales bacterium]
MKTAIPSAAQRGFSMIEVLITMFVIAMALLGTAALQAYSLKVSQGGQFRTQAVMLATDLVERLAANTAAAAAGNYVATLPSSSTVSDCSASACSPQQMAQYDLARFQDHMQAALPDATATISRSGTGPWLYTVQITWKERSFKRKDSNSSLAGPTESFSYTVSRRVNDPSAVS